MDLLNTGLVQYESIIQTSLLPLAVTPTLMLMQMHGDTHMHLYIVKEGSPYWGKCYYIGYASHLAKGNNINPWIIFICALN